VNTNIKHNNKRFFRWPAKKLASEHIENL